MQHFGAPVSIFDSFFGNSGTARMSLDGPISSEQHKQPKKDSGT